MWFALGVNSSPLMLFNGPFLRHLVASAYTISGVARLAQNAVTAQRRGISHDFDRAVLK
jgi:hypothetical protein